MPMYTWLDKNSGNEIEIIRSIADSDVPPTEEEARQGEQPQAAGEVPKERNWQKLMSPVQRHTYGDNWTGRKGMWTIVAIVLTKLVLNGGLYRG